MHDSTGESNVSLLRKVLEAYRSLPWQCVGGCRGPCSKECQLCATLEFQTRFAVKRAMRGETETTAEDFEVLAKVLTYFREIDVPGIYSAYCLLQEKLKSLEVLGLPDAYDYE